MQDLTYRLPQKRTITSAPTDGENARLDARRGEAVARALAPGLPRYIVDGDGGVLIDVDGNSLIDFASGIAVTSVGVSNPRVTAAITEAAKKFTHTCFLVTGYEGFIEVSEKLNELTPGNFKKKTALFNSGAEAVENAVKIARAYTGKFAVATFDNAYHGRTNFTLAMTAKNKPYKTGFGPFASDVHRLPMSYPLRDGLSGQEAADRAIRVLEGQIGVENLACVVMETIQGEGGFIEPAEGFMPAIAKWCRENNVVFVADEIQAGVARTGDMFACNHEGVEPDLITSAKALAAGMPLSAVTGRAEIMDAPGPGALGGTYAGNPLACAAAMAVFEEIEENDLCGRAREIESIIRTHLEPLLSHDEVKEVRGRGAMIAIELDTAERTAAVANACKEQGVITLTCGVDGNVIRLLPPLVIPEALLNEGLEILVGAIKDSL
ncbi:4-aminobutyrate--2-oxoglutarate transaminase [Corynebacterium meitnerae]|uniref:(S)-3-amino-2-methylpropionate transaminase n=1 Tax=Corynebacterium meitnerae TaxID=2913498 RepID=A0A9X3RJC3_9CORY|nr:4-aminobutyrate--2-oxoglutarate transaminase [Corynebacterium meitnerae]MCZ9294304.1 4-aminobutyrate--2-oxoglutarate transaminase [Corynebacterium meitnerae]